MELEPNNKTILLNNAWAYTEMEDYDPAKKLLEKCLEIDPQYEDAIATSNQLYDRSRVGDYPEEWALLHLAGLYVAVGRQNEARSLVAKALKIKPSLSLVFFKQTQPFKDPAHMQRELGALKKAGLK